MKKKFQNPCDTKNPVTIKIKVIQVLQELLKSIELILPKDYQKLYFYRLV